MRKTDTNKKTCKTQIIMQHASVHCRGRGISSGVPRRQDVAEAEGLQQVESASPKIEDECTFVLRANMPRSFMLYLKRRQGMRHA
mmetsp:Transcript_38957/g.82843  ORF Transcript_38957/g.82843 Transcript_38957/m.82843 type:complete len:85 (+) Transcript_38957:375-629(+)